MNTTATLSLWQKFQEQHQLSPQQVEQFQRYAETLLQYELHNVTAITNLEDIVKYHFEDSLILAQTVPLNAIHVLADVGTGGGFPAIPLKIVFPHLKLILIEVQQKRITFLRHIIEQLSLTSIEFYEQDWRTFLRKTAYPIDLFVARASLAPDELIRAFRSNSPYIHTSIMYWASDTWHPDTRVVQFILSTYPYVVGNRKRKLITLRSSGGNLP